MRSLTYKWIMLSLAFLTALTLHLLLFSYSLLIPLIKLEMNLSHVQAGLVFSACILSITLLRIPWGFLSDRIGFAKAMKISMIFIGLFGLIRAFAPSYEFLLISQLFLGVGFAAILPCLPKLVNAWFKGEVGFATGAYVAGFPFGEMLGFSLTPWLLEIRESWRGVFEVFGVWSVTLAILWWVFGRELGEGTGEVEATSIKSDFVSLLKVRETWILAGICICSMGFYDTLALWLPYILELKGISPKVAGLASSILPLGFLFAGPVIGAASDKVGLRKPFILFLGLISGVTTILMATLLGIHLWIAIFSTGFFITGILTLVLVIPTELPEFRRFIGSAVGLISSLGNAGSLLMPVAVGYILDLTGSFIPVMAMLAIVSGLNSLLSLVLRETGARGKCPGYIR